MADLVGFCLEEGIPFTFLFLDNPLHLSAFAMPEGLRKEASQRVRTRLSKMNRREAASSTASAAWRLVNALEQTDKSEVAPNLVRDFMQFTNDLDASRKQNVRETLPELVRALAAAGFPWNANRKFCEASVPAAAAS
jgi:hypothetical protein